MWRSHIGPACCMCLCVPSHWPSLLYVSLCAVTLAQFVVCVPVCRHISPVCCMCLCVPSHWPRLLYVYVCVVTLAQFVVGAYVSLCAVTLAQLVVCASACRHNSPGCCVFACRHISSACCVSDPLRAVTPCLSHLDKARLMVMSGLLYFTLR